MDYVEETHFNTSFTPCSSPATFWSYDVFLSFRGEDTRNNFTDHLHMALDQAGIRTFRDDHGLERGQEISLEILRAIQESRISIVVLSQNYAASRWCLEELAKIMQCKKEAGQLVFPVFYHVDPCDARKQAGSFADAFQRLEKRFADEEVGKWRKVLTEAANLSGWDLQIAPNRSEAKSIKDIVSNVLLVVNQTHLHVAKYPVGLDSRMHILFQLLEIENDDVRMVGICGMGGIGKTTLAKYVYNSIIGNFRYSSFLANVREQSKQPNGSVRLQEQLLSEVLKNGELKVGNVDRGASILKERLSGKKVLIVLDDLDQIEQLEALAGEKAWFAAGSRIIITTRDMHLLDEAGVERRYEIKELNNKEALRLFSWHAFREPFPLQKYKELSEEIVSYAGGLPLALEVIGSSLVKRSLDYWGSMLKKLKEIPPRKILEILRLSYDSLGDHQEKAIFLDFACFFNGIREEYALKIFDACGFHGDVGIETLKDKCLLKVSPHNRLRMHDLVRDMGREIVRGKYPAEHGKHTRLWQHEAISHVLTNDEATEAIEVIILDLPTQKHFSTRHFARMPNLRLLRINNANLDGSFKGLFKNLRWLCWPKCPLKSLPSEFHPPKLVSLGMPTSNLRILWQGKKVLNNLKLLHLSGSELLTTIPDLSGVQNLEELRLNGCLSLSIIHVSIGYLGKLITLDLGECENLKSLPSSIGHLRSLEELNLCGCLHLEELPEQLGNLTCLRRLYASYSWVKQLPHSLGLLNQLYHLELNGCENLKKLPDSFCNLRLLERLRLEECSNLEGLPQDLGVMKGLRGIYASGSGIKELPDSVGNLAHLTELWLVNCESLKGLPASIHNLRSLEYLYLNNCSSLERLPEELGYIESLRELNAEGTAIEQLPDSTGRLLNLKYLSLRDCKQLIGLPNSICDLLALEQLCLSGCLSLKNLNLDGYRSCQLVQEFPPQLQTFLDKLPNLSNLDLKNCNRLVEIQGLENLKSVKEIDLRGCSSLSTKSFLFQGYFEGQHEVCVIYVPKQEIPEWFEYQGLGGSLLIFDVPSDVPPGCLQLTLWINYVFSKCLTYFYVRVRNNTTGTEWAGYIHGRPFEVGSCVIHIMPKKGIKSGDRIVVSFQLVDMCGVHLHIPEKVDLQTAIFVSFIKDRFHMKRQRDFSLAETSCSMMKLSKRPKSSFQQFHSGAHP